MSLASALLSVVTWLGCPVYTHKLGYKRLDCKIVPSPNRKHHHPHPHIKNHLKNQADSTNWSGYVSALKLNSQKKGLVSAVSGTWKVPNVVKSSGNDTYCAIWIGIDGFNSDTVEQIGTSHDFEYGKQQNYAWYEMYPNYPGIIEGFPVNVGDFITASVQAKPKGKFVLQLDNNTQKVYTTIPSEKTKSRAADLSCAEWVVEAPFSGGVLHLSNFGQVDFSNCQATINGITGAINGNAWKNESIAMEDPKSVKALPAPLSADGKSFSVQWKHE